MPKRLLQLFVLIPLFIGLISCDQTEEPTDWVVLPDLSGMVEEDITALLDSLNVNYDIEYHDTQSLVYELQFIMYINYDVGDIVATSDEVRILLYPEYIPETVINLPDFAGFTESDIVQYLSEGGIVYYIKDIPTEDTSLDGDFAGYDGSYQAGDMFDNISAVGIRIYRYEEPISDEYFQVLDLVYDGPILDESLIGAEYMNPRGGAFEVSLYSCTDGDTARFVYPNDIYDSIQSGAKSTRFLNMDTEETYTGGEEEWGKPASVYTCSLLESATSIVLQTDPGDGLLDTYGRLLAWIWVELPGDDHYQLLNYMVVRQGLAQVKYEFGAGETIYNGENTYNEWMHIAEDLAIDEDLGQWGNLLDYYWNYDTDEPFYSRWYE